MKTINIYLDTSGSMKVMGKDSALLYIAKSIYDYCQSKTIETCYYSLAGQKIVSLAGIKYSNDMILESKTILDNSVLLSDGLFKTDEEKLFDLSIAIGIDADKNKLNQISDKVFVNDNVLMALEYLLFKKDIIEDIIINSEDEEYEWE